MTPRGLFITATGTGVGKTFVTRAIALACRRAGHQVAALKPVETGYVDPAASDAHSLALACGQPHLRDAQGFYRAPQPLAPAAVPLTGGPTAPALTALTGAVRAAGAAASRVLVEGAGGLLVPLDARHDMADLAAALGFPLVLVAPNQLGVLSYVLTAHECARARHLELCAVVLVEQPEPDLSAETNARLLRRRLGLPVVPLPRLAGDGAPLEWAATLLPQLPL